MQTIIRIAQRGYRLLTAVVLALLAGLCPWHRTWRQYGVRTGKPNQTPER